MADPEPIRDSGGRAEVRDGRLGPEPVRVGREGVVRIADSRTGRMAEVRPVRGGPLRVVVRPVDGDGPGDLRALLVADLLLRAAAVAGVTVLVGQGGTVPGGLAELGIHPPGALEELGPRPADLQVVAPGAEAEGEGVVVAVGPVRLPARYGGGEPSALRLALLGYRIWEPARITAGALRAAAERLDRWRERVARWAESPSRPANPEAVRRIRAALDGGLDTAAVLAALDELERDPAVPDGSKFETFLLADRVLALELASRIGRS